MIISKIINNLNNIYMKKHLITALVFIVSYANAQVTDYGMTSNAHKEYVGQIVFSKKPIKFKNENISEFTQDFSFPDDKAYFMAYFPKSIANRCFEEHGALPEIYNARITFTFFINGEKAGSSKQDINQFQLNEWTGWSDPENPFGIEKGILPAYALAFRDDVAHHLKKGVSDIKIVVGYTVIANNKEVSNIKPLTEGSLKITMKEDYKKKYKAPPKAVMKDINLEKKIKETLTFRWKSMEILEVILTDKEWRIERNALGVPVCKVLQVYAITRPKEGEYSNTCFATPFEMEKEYLENGKYSTKILWHSSGGRDKYEVICK